MLEPPPLDPDRIAARLRAAYGLTPMGVTFLPLGADVDTAVYRVVTDDGTEYFLKLRRGNVPEVTITVPYWFARSGRASLIAPVTTRTGALWTKLDDSFTAVLYPFVRGRDGWGLRLSSAQWLELGHALRSLHTADLPQSLLESIPRETYSAGWRDRVRDYLNRATRHRFDDAEADGLARLLRDRRDVIEHMVRRAGELAKVLAREELPLCFCHGDIHAGNILIADDGRLYLVDWDTLILAPKERDLMFVGAGIGGIWKDEDEIAAFYRGYGETVIHPVALAYYRYERIVQDIAAYCEQLLDSLAGGEDRVEGLHQISGQFEAGGVVDIARATDEALREVE